MSYQNFLSRIHHYSIFFCLLFISYHSFSQSVTEITRGKNLETREQVELPNTYFEIGFGVGPNYGIIGVKGVLGYKGTGLLLGVGSFSGFTTTSFGVQVAYRSAYISLTAADYGSYEVNTNGKKEEGLISGIVFMLGARPNLTSNKKLFLDFGLGYASGGTIPSPFGTTQENQVTFSFGIGYKI